MNKFKHFSYVVAFLFLNVACGDHVDDHASFISVSEIDGQWWFIDPDGTPFVSLGINHIEPTLMLAPYNIDIAYEKYGSDFTYWNHVFNPDGVAVRVWLDEVKDNFNKWGFNTFAYHTSVPLHLVNDFYFMPIIRTAPVEVYSLNKQIPDVFSETFRAHAERVVADVTQRYSGEPNLLGYSLSDIPDWTLPSNQYFNLWVDTSQRRGADEPAKAEWIDVLKKHYDNPAAAAANYSFEADNWDDMLHHTDWQHAIDSEQARIDTENMLLRIIEQWCKVHHDLVKRYDPHHLLLGDKIGRYTNIHPDAWEILGRYYDVITIQWYAFFDQQEERLKTIYRKTGKPILMGDSSFSIVKPYQERGAKGAKVESQDAVGDAYYNYLKELMHLPFVVGWHYCGYIEGAVGIEGAGRFAYRQSGFIDPWGNPFEYTLERVTEANNLAVSWREQSRDLNR